MCKLVNNSPSVYGLYKLSIHPYVSAVQDFADDFLSKGCMELLTVDLVVIKKIVKYSIMFLL
jgi:hypothetical protein